MLERESFLPEGLRGVLSGAEAAGIEQPRYVLEPHVNYLVAHGQRTVDPLLQVENRGEVVVATRSLDVLGTDLETGR